MDRCLKSKLNFISFRNDKSNFQVISKSNRSFAKERNPFNNLNLGVSEVGPQTIKKTLKLIELGSRFVLLLCPLKSLNSFHAENHEVERLRSLRIVREKKQTKPTKSVPRVTV